ncbi:MAG: discoidin domain-containing protein [Candidatus Hydrogenedentes bacterium]|nr:discoidin domain-containing protein [Candidatus Hydrogenedentota bacterium]
MYSIRRNLLGLCAALALMLSGLAYAQEAPAPIQNLDDAFNRILTYELGQDGAAMEYIIAEVRRVQQLPGDREALANRLAALLHTEATFQCKLFACRWLFVIGTEGQVDTLAPLLIDATYSDMARYALQAIPGDKVDQALLGALQAADISLKAGLANALGERRSAVAEAVLAEAVKAALAQATLAGPEKAYALAATTALGAIGTPTALEVLTPVLTAADRELRNRAVERWLASADRAYANGETDVARARYEAIFNETQPEYVQRAALEGLVMTDADGGTARIVGLITGENPAWQHQALAYVRRLGGEGATAAYAATFDALPPERQEPLLLALAGRGDAAALELMVRATQSPVEAVQRAAVAGMGSLGNSGTIDALTAFALAEGSPLQETAKDGLSKLRGEDVDAALIGRLEASTAPATDRLLIGVLTERGAKSAVPALLAVAGARPEVAGDAFGALGTLAGAQDVEALLDRLIAATDPAVRTRGEQAVTSVCSRAPGGAASCAATVQTRYAAQAPEAQAARVSLLNLLSDLGDDATLPTVAQATADADPVVQEGAARALAAWKSITPIPDLFALAQSANAAVAGIAFEGYVRLLRVASPRTPAETLALYDQVLPLAIDKTQRLALLAGLSEVADLTAIERVDAIAAAGDAIDEAALAREAVRSKFYVAKASSNEADAAKAFDRDIDTRWSTAETQRPGQWFEIDIAREASIKGLVLDSSRSASDYPRQFEVFVSADGAAWGAAVATGVAETPVLELSFPPTPGRFVRIVQQGTAESNLWSIHELRVIAD